MPKCSVIRKPYPPGILGKGKGKKPRKGLSEYGIQLKERQKIKLTYGIRQRQYENYLDEASKKKGADPTTQLFELLESRLDNVVFRIGFSGSRSGARQMVSHGHIIVNGRKMNISSLSLKKGDKVSIRPQSADKGILKDIDIKLKKYNPPSWLNVDKEKKEGEIVGRPTIIN